MRTLAVAFMVFCCLGADDCNDGPSRVEVAQQHFGGSSICSWRVGDTANKEVICIAEGVRFVCLVDVPTRNVQCAQTQDKEIVEK